jgi:hypothetical protein
LPTTGHSAAAQEAEMHGIMKNVLAAVISMTFVICNTIAFMGFNKTIAAAEDVDYGTNRNENKKFAAKARLDIAAKFNINVEDIDCETSFSKPSFGKAYHKSGSVQEYCGAIKPDVVPDYQLLRTAYQNGQDHPVWSMGDSGILCSLLLIAVLIIWGRSWFIRNGSKPAL